MTDRRSAPAHADLVVQVQRGNDDAFARLVVAFQDMAVGYGYSILGDFQLAEDAAQEAFLDAWRHIGSLREPVAFPGWLRRIVFKHCDRRTRRHDPPTSSLEAIGDEPFEGPSPADIAEGHQMRDRLMEALATLPERQRSVLVLHHMSGHSVAEIGEFLGVPAGTIKKRLHDARARAREVLLAGLAHQLEVKRPSHDASFARAVVEILQAARQGDAQRVKELLLEDPGLRQGRDLMGNTPLIVAAACGRSEVVALLRASGAPVDLHEAAAIGDTARVSVLLDEKPGRLDEFSPEGFTPVALAAHFGQAEALRLLLARGADGSRVSRHPLGVTPLHAALFGRRRETALLLITHGADVSSRRGGAGMPRTGWTPLHYAVAAGFCDVIRSLLAKGADASVRDHAGETALDVARAMGQEEPARILEQKEGSS